jgi:putative membrane protein
MIDWRHWHNEPWLVGGLVAFGWLWAVLAGPLRPRLAPGEPFPRGHAFRFFAGLLCFYVAVGSPLDQAGERFLFSAHMLQHHLLVYPAAILFLRGLPPWMIDPLIGRPGWHRPLRLLTHPVICALLFSLVVSVWHAPSLYDWALQDRIVHIVEHLMFFATGLLYWWPLLSPSRVRPPISYGGQMIYLLAVVIALTPLFAYVTFSGDILYPTYEYAPRIIAGFTAAEDQLLAGVMIKMLSVGVSLIAFGFAFRRWYQEQK